VNNKYLLGMTCPETHSVTTTSGLQDIMKPLKNDLPFWPLFGENLFDYLCKTLIFTHHDKQNDSRSFTLSTKKTRLDLFQ
jgi:hypothetical protein